MLHCIGGWTNVFESYDNPKHLQRLPRILRATKRYHACYGKALAQYFETWAKGLAMKGNRTSSSKTETCCEYNCFTV